MLGDTVGNFLAFSVFVCVIAPNSDGTGIYCIRIVKPLINICVTPWFNAVIA